MQIWRPECMSLPRYSASTENTLFLPKIGEFWPKIFSSALKSIPYPKINLGCKYEHLNAYCIDIVQIPKRKLFLPKIGKLWPKIFTTSRKSITYPKIHLGCKYERLNVHYCADLVGISKIHYKKSDTNPLCAEITQK